MRSDLPVCLDADGPCCPPSGQCGNTVPAPACTSLCPKWRCCCYLVRRAGTSNTRASDDSGLSRSRHADVMSSHEMFFEAAECHIGSAYVAVKACWSCGPGEVICTARPSVPSRSKWDRGRGPRAQGAHARPLALPAPALCLTSVCWDF